MPTGRAPHAVTLPPTTPSANLHRVKADCRRKTLTSNKMPTVTDPPTTLARRLWTVPASVDSRGSCPIRREFVDGFDSS
jgi:hypothetical protein